MGNFSSNHIKLEDGKTPDITIVRIVDAPDSFDFLKDKSMILSRNADWVYYEHEGRVISINSSDIQNAFKWTQGITLSELTAKLLNDKMFAGGTKLVADQKLLNNIVTQLNRVYAADDLDDINTFGDVQLTDYEIMQLNLRNNLNLRPETSFVAIVKDLTSNVQVEYDSSNNTLFTGVGGIYIPYSFFTQATFNIPSEIVFVCADETTPLPPNTLVRCIQDTKGSAVEKAVNLKKDAWEPPVIRFNVLARMSAYVQRFSIMRNAFAKVKSHPHPQKIGQIEFPFGQYSHQHNLTAFKLKSYFEARDWILIPIFTMYFTDGNMNIVTANNYPVTILVNSNIRMKLRKPQNTEFFIFVDDTPSSESPQPNVSVFTGTNMGDAEFQKILDAANAYIADPSKFQVQASSSP